MDQTDMQQLTARTEQFVNAISGAILGTVEVAAERVSLAAEVAITSQRTNAFSAVLEVIAAQKDGLAARLAGAKGAMRSLLQRQIEVLTEQEATVLARAGAAPEVAHAAIENADAQLYRREGSRFVSVHGATGNGAV